MSNYRAPKNTHILLRLVIYRISAEDVWWRRGRENSRARRVVSTVGVMSAVLAYTVRMTIRLRDVKVF